MDEFITNVRSMKDNSAIQIIDNLLSEHFQNKINLITLFPPYEKFSKVNADFKCCIIRNPIERFVSAFRNRILYFYPVKIQWYPPPRK